MATQSAKRIGQAVAFDLPFDGSCLIRPGGKARIMAKSHEDVEQILFQLGHTFERLVEGVHACRLTGRAEGGSRHVPARLRQLAGKVADKLQDLIESVLDKDVQQLVEEVKVSLLNASNAFTPLRMGPELFQSMKDELVCRRRETEKKQSLLATFAWSRCLDLYRVMLAALPENSAVWADAGSLKARLLVPDDREKEHLRILAEEFLTWSPKRVRRAVKNRHPALIKIEFHFGSPSVCEAGAAGRVRKEASTPSSDVRDHSAAGGTSMPDQPAAKGNMTCALADQIARKLAKKNSNFVNGGVREWAKAIIKATGKKTCSLPTVKKTHFWKQTMKESGRGRRKGKTPRAVELTTNVERTHGRGDRSNMLDTLLAEEEVAEKVVQRSSLPPEGQQALLAELHAGTKTPAQIIEIAELHPRKPASRNKRFRQV